MSLLAFKHFRHVESGGIVQVVETTFGEDADTGKPIMFVKIAHECGREQYYDIENFILTFELVEELRSAILTAPASDSAFWRAVEELAVEFGVTLEYGDEFASTVSTVAEAEEHEGDGLEGVKRLH